MPKKSTPTIKSDLVVETSEERDHCRCCHCGAGQEDVRNQSYIKMREHLQQRLKAKTNGSNCISPSGSRSGSIKNNLNGDSELDSLVNFIEGHQCPQTGPINPKKAAKKARQKQRKLAEQLNGEAAEEKSVSSKPSLPLNTVEDRIPNGMVRITHNPLTNSAVITPLYGPIEPNPSYLQQPMSYPQPAKLAPNLPLVVDSSAPNQAQLGTKVSPPKPSVFPSSFGSSTTSQPQQMVTIRRIMQPNLSEPVVTVTLKGDTSDNDRVLFTMVNGQVIPTSKNSSTSASKTVSAPSSVSVPNQVEAKPVAPPALSRKKQKKLEKKKQKKLLKKQAEAEAAAKLEALSRPSFNQHAFAKPPCGAAESGSDFTLDNFRLPPGITLTRVQGSPNRDHPELPMRVIANHKDRGTHNARSASINSTASANPIIVTSPLVAPKLKQPSGGLAAPNVIVVDTRKIQQQQQKEHEEQQHYQQHKPRVQMQSVGVQTGEDDDQVPEQQSLTKKQRKKLRRREEKLQQQQEQQCITQMAALQIKSKKQQLQQHQTKKKEFSNETTNSSTPASTNGANNKISGSSTNNSSKGKKKKRPVAVQANSELDKWEENIFVPKSDLDLERGDLDEDERELEAFKRFCFNTVPPERKEKVRIHLNVKDIFGKKSNNGLHMTSCK